MHSHQTVNEIFENGDRRDACPTRRITRQPTCSSASFGLRSELRNPDLISMVGATGVEPARIAPQDPKSCASANSATRPRGVEAVAESIARKQCFEQARACGAGIGAAGKTGVLARTDPRRERCCVNGGFGVRNSPCAHSRLSLSYPQLSPLLLHPAFGQRTRLSRPSFANYSANKWVRRTFSRLLSPRQLLRLRPSRRPHRNRHRR